MRKSYWNQPALVQPPPESQLQPAIQVVSFTAVLLGAGAVPSTFPTMSASAGSYVRMSWGGVVTGFAIAMPARKRNPQTHTNEIPRYLFMLIPPYELAIPR